MGKDKNSRCFRHSNKEEIYWHVRPSLIGGGYAHFGRLGILAAPRDQAGLTL